MFLNQRIKDGELNVKHLTKIEVPKIPHSLKALISLQSYERIQITLNKYLWNKKCDKSLNAIFKISFERSPPNKRREYNSTCGRRGYWWSPCCRGGCRYNHLSCQTER